MESDEKMMAPAASKDIIQEMKNKFYIKCSTKFTNYYLSVRMLYA